MPVRTDSRPPPGALRWLRNPWLLAGAVGALSLALRTWVASEQLATNPMLRLPWLDDAAYLEFARALGEGTPRSWFLAPLYPWLLAQAERVFEPGLPLACGLNVVLGSATSVAAALAARNLGSAAAGWTAGALHALLGASVFSDVTPGQEPALCLLHLLTLSAAVRFWRGGGWRAAGALGLFTGLAVLGRATSAGLLLGALPGLRRQAPRARWIASAVCVAGLALALLPAALLNRSLNGDLSPLPWGGGVVLYFANGPDSRASVSYLATQLGDRPDQIEARARSLAAAAAGRPLSPRETSAWWAAEAWRTRGSLAELLAHLGRKGLLFLSHEDRGSNHAVSVERDYARWLRVAPVGSAWLIAWGTAAAWLLRRRRPEIDAALWMLAGSWLLITLAFPVGRYRLPIALVLLVPLACGLVEVAAGGVRGRRVLGALALGLALTLLGFAPIREPDDGLAHVNVARAHFQLGEQAQARARLEALLAQRPQHGPALETLGRIELAAGRPREALAHLRRAAPDPRTRFGAQVAGVLALVELGRAVEARRLADALLGQRPDDPELLAFAALAAWASGDVVTARRHLDTARRLAPNSAPVRAVQRRTNL